MVARDKNFRWCVWHFEPCMTLFRRDLGRLTVVHWCELRYDWLTDVMLIVELNDPKEIENTNWKKIKF